MQSEAYLSWLLISVSLALLERGVAGLSVVDVEGWRIVRGVLG